MSPVTDFWLRAAKYYHPYVINKHIMPDTLLQTIPVSSSIT